MDSALLSSLSAPRACASAPRCRPLPQAVAPHMIRQRSGLIVMIGSVVSLMATPFGAAYSGERGMLG